MILAVLATIDRVASNLKGPQAKKQLGDAMKGMVGALNIQKDIQIDLSHEVSRGIDAIGYSYRRSSCLDNGKPSSILPLGYP